MHFSKAVIVAFLAATYLAVAAPVPDDLREADVDIPKTRFTEPEYAPLPDETLAANVNFPKTQFTEPELESCQGQHYSRDLSKREPETSGG